MELRQVLVIKQFTSFLLVLCVLVSSFALVGAVNADSKTIIVPDDYTNIQEGINNANPGDTVYVKNGTYYFEGPTSKERIDGITINKSISLIGENNQATIFRPIYKGTSRLRSYIHVTADNVLISGFTMISTIDEVQFQDMTRKVTGYVQRGVFLHTTDFVSPDPHGCKIIGNIFVGNSLSSIEDHSKGATVSENQFIREGNISGEIKLIYASDTTIVNNTFSSNGINGWGSKNITIKQNQMTGEWSDDETTHQVYDSPMYLSGDTFHIYENNITNWGAGITFSGKTNCTVYNNTIADNKYGIVLQTYDVNTENALDNGNIVYHNDFLNNEKHVFAGDSNSNQVSSGSETITEIVSWDCNKIGNYWDDYKGTDHNQDKIGDSPYVFDANNQDNYPLMERFEFIEIKTNPTTEYPLWLVILTTAVIIGITAVIYLKTQKK